MTEHSAENDAGPFGLAPSRDISVRRTDSGWLVACADCWAFGGAPTWPLAMAQANHHAATEHVIPPADDRDPKPCSKCGEVCTYDGWGHVHANGIGIGSCPIPPAAWLAQTLCEWHDAESGRLEGEPFPCAACMAQAEYVVEQARTIPPAACACGHPSDDHDDEGACMHLCDCAWPIPPASGSVCRHGNTVPPGTIAACSCVNPPGKKDEP